MGGYPGGRNRSSLACASASTGFFVVVGAAAAFDDAWPPDDGQNNHAASPTASTAVMPPKTRARTNPPVPDRHHARMDRQRCREAALRTCPRRRGGSAGHTPLAGHRLVGGRHDVQWSGVLVGVSFVELSSDKGGCDSHGGGAELMPEPPYRSVSLQNPHASIMRVMGDGPRCAPMRG